MYKSLARIFLEITNIRVERVQDISWEDAPKEGWPRDRELFPTINTGSKAKLWFQHLWDSLNAKPKPVIENKKVAYYVSYPWEEIRETRNYRGKKWYIYGNPWVWVIEFKRL